MHRDYHRDVVVQFRKDTSPLHIPGVAMHEVRFELQRVEIQASLERAED
jgi:hypothetical protein